MLEKLRPAERRLANAWRRERGIGRLLGSESSDAKTAKSNATSEEYVNRIMYLSPGPLLCPKASPACLAACLNTAGRGQMNSVQLARARKTTAFFEDHHGFLETLRVEIFNARHLTRKRGKRLALRLNGTSDVVWERIAPWLFEEFSDVQFYDYTKIARRFGVGGPWHLPANYHLTFSRSETNAGECEAVRERGGNVCVVYTGERPEYLHDADSTDLRFTDPKGSRGYLIGVTAKGRAVQDTSGFVVHFA